MKTVVGHWEYPAGTPAAGGKLKLILSQAAVVTASPSQVANAVYEVILDSNGDIPANTQIYANDELTPPGTWYNVTVTLSSAGLVYGPESFFLVGSSPININDQIPESPVAQPDFIGGVQIKGVPNQGDVPIATDPKNAYWGVPSFTGLQVETDGVLNVDQSKLNLIAGTNVTLTADSEGGVTIDSTGGGGGSSAFNDLTSGTNTTASMVVGSGASLTPTGTGTINATEIGGIPITGMLTHAGQIPISQPGNTSAVWADPLVQGIQAEGTTASTVSPVLIAGKDGSGNLKDLVLDSSGCVGVNVNGTVPVSGTFWQATQPVSGSVSVSNFPSSQAVTGTFWQATQPVSGTVGVSGSVAVTGTFWQATQPVSGSVSVSNFPSSQAVTGTFWQTTQPVSSTQLPSALDGSGDLKVAVQNTSLAVTGTFWQATQPVSGSVSVSNFPASQAVTGTFWQATQPVSGSVSVSNFPSTQAVTGTFWQATQPVSGTVTANISGSISNTAFGVTGDVAIINSATVGKTKIAVTADPITFASAQHVVVDSATLGTVAVSGTFWQATQPVSFSGQSVGITGTVTTDPSDRAGRLLGVVYGSQGQQVKQTATNYNLATELYTGSTAYDARQIRALTSSDVVTAAQASAANLNATVVGTGTFAVQATLNAETTKVIGTVNVAAAQTIAVTQSTAANLNATVAFSAPQHVIVDSASLGTVAVSGTFWQSTQPVSIGAAVSTSPAAPTTATYSLATINFSGSGDNTIIAGSGSQTIRIYKVQFTVTGTTNITFKDSTPTTLSGAYVLTGNGSSFSDWMNGAPLMVTASGKGFVINSSLAVSIQGQIWYTQS